MKLKDKGVAFFVCPCCGYKFRIFKGRIKFPKIEQINEWLYRARCPKCGILVRGNKKK